MIIPPEIHNDEFYYSIIETIKKYNSKIKNVLEIGASSGEGSTEAFILGCREIPDVNFFSIEIFKDRFSLLKERYKDSFFKPYNGSSIELDEYPNFKNTIDFYHTTRSILNNYDIDLIRNWYDEEINYIKNNNTTCGIIDKIKEENSIENFDVVLIDGSEFTGYVEFLKIKNSSIIMLDDICSMKTYNVHHELINDNNYTLLTKNETIRNGFSIHIKKSFL